MFVAYVKMNRKDLVRRLLSSGMVDVDSNKNINAEDDEAPLPSVGARAPKEDEAPSPSAGA